MVKRSLFFFVPLLTSNFHVQYNSDSLGICQFSVILFGGFSILCPVIFPPNNYMFDLIILAI